MRRRLALCLAVGTGAISLFAVGSASAAVEFGDPCIVNETDEGPITYFEFGATGNPLPAAAPVSGVLTKWKMNVSPIPFAIATTMKVLRVNTVSKTASVIAEMSAGVVGGANTIPARIPIQAGDYLGVATGGGEVGILLCTSPTENQLGIALAGSPGGPPGPYFAGPIKGRVPLVGVIEPDVDGDGFGDETQDGCPQSALYHTACPVISVATINLTGKDSATILVATSNDAPVQVSGTVKLGNGTKAKLSSKKKTVPAGKLVSFKLKFPGNLKEKLKELAPSQKLTLDVTAKATNVAGQVSTDKSKAKLKGQGK